MEAGAGDRPVTSIPPYPGGQDPAPPGTGSGLPARKAVAVALLAVQAGLAGLVGLLLLLGARRARRRAVARVAHPGGIGLVLVVAAAGLALAAWALGTRRSWAPVVVYVVEAVVALGVLVRFHPLRSGLALLVAAAVVVLVAVPEQPSPTAPGLGP